MDLKSRPLVAAAICATALALAFPGPGWSILAWPALIPYLQFLRAKPRWRSVVSAHLLLSAVWFGGVLYWIPGVLTGYGGFAWHGAVAVFVLMAAVLALFLSPFTALTRWAADKGPDRALLVAPGAWILSELIRDRLALGGFPWVTLGATQAPDSYWSQIADLGGVYSVGFLIVAVNAGAVASLGKKPNRRLAAWILAAWAAAGLYGVYRIHVWSPPDGSRLKVALVQPAIPQAGDREAFARTYFETLPKFYAAAVEQGAEWVIFPESPNPFVRERDFYYTTFWSRLVADHGVPLLLTGPAIDAVTGRRRNSAFSLGPDGEALHRYDKIRLVPFGEYLPWGDVLGFAAPLVGDAGGFEPGEDSGSETGEVAGMRFGPLICFEAVFPELARSRVREGAEVLVNVTNDAWFGQTSAPRQHLRLAAFRAVEQRKPLLRAANSGITVFIDPWGSLSQTLPLGQPGTLSAEVAGNRWRTLYGYVGDWPAMLAAVLALVGAAAPARGGGPRRKRKAPRRRKNA